MGANTRGIAAVSERELELGRLGTEPASWHYQYRNSACVFVGGLDKRLSEGDIATVMSQFGDLVDVRIKRDRETGQSKGFAFIVYRDQRSTILAVDNFNGAKVMGRTLTVDHSEYRPGEKNDSDSEPEVTFQSYLEKERLKYKKELLAAAKDERKEEKKAKKAAKKVKKQALEAKKLRLRLMKGAAASSSDDDSDSSSSSSSSAPARRRRRRRDDSSDDSHRRRREKEKKGKKDRRDDRDRDRDRRGDRRDDRDDRDRRRRRSRSRS
eukprot:TRINITY_DN175_c4_g1_i1.p1 TRINITY_DN175_c4_g1~~TRINITY_DN175_c4_g1_i1.p1  ORF type:complete len:267 (+),score=113.72 TRINITY_DN175_c4_g1_i1:48-848(+)